MKKLVVAAAACVPLVSASCCLPALSDRNSGSGSSSGSGSGSTATASCGSLYKPAVALALTSIADNYQGWLDAADIDGDGLMDVVHGEGSAVFLALSLGDGTFGADLQLDDGGQQFSLVHFPAGNAIALNRADDSGRLILLSMKNGKFVRVPGPPLGQFDVSRVLSGRFFGQTDGDLAIVDDNSSSVLFAANHQDGGWVTTLVQSDAGAISNCFDSHPTPGWAVGPVSAARDQLWLREGSVAVSLSISENGQPRRTTYATDTEGFSPYGIGVGKFLKASPVAVAVTDYVSLNFISASSQRILLELPGDCTSCERAGIGFSDVNGDGLADIVCKSKQYFGDFGFNVVLSVSLSQGDGGFCTETEKADYLVTFVIGSFREGVAGDIVALDTSGYVFFARNGH